MDDQPRRDANSDEQAYTLTVEEAAALYEAAGHGRTARAIQKYCARGDLTCIREQMTFGERFRPLPILAEDSHPQGDPGETRTRAATRALAAPKPTVCAVIIRKTPR